MADTTVVREPEWLAARRSRAAELASSLDLPQFKGTPGWEFTSLAKFSLDAFAPAAAGEGDAGAVDRVQTLLEAPEGAITLGQVDGLVLETPDAVEDGPVVLPLSLAVERHPELVEPHLGTIVAGRPGRLHGRQRRRAGPAARSSTSRAACASTPRSC